LSRACFVLAFFPASFLRTASFEAGQRRGVVRFRGTLRERNPGNRISRLRILRRVFVDSRLIFSEAPRASMQASQQECICRCNGLLSFEKEKTMLLMIVLIILIFGTGFGGYRMGPGWGYYGGG
jgi:hypothetical protein